ncbi:MAG: integrase core domain-containing protein, partial [Terriglobia bacterium]
MQLKSLRWPRSRYLERGAVELSREAHKRLQWFDYYQVHGRNAALTCRYFGISRQTFYRWKRRYDSEQLSTLEDHSHRPRRRRHPTWTAEQAERVRRLREEYPRWGKDKLAVLLRREGWAVSVSMVGRILTFLRQRGALRAPVVFRVKRRRGTANRPWALRKPKDYAVEKPGDLVQLDTMDLRPAPGVILKQFTARDMVSRWDVIEVHHRATSTAAALFLDTLQRRLPFPLRALQVDGGSEFSAVFEQACQQRGLRLFVLPPRSPKLNGQVERANRTHTEEFYEITPCSLPITQLNQELQNWERTYNTVRPHQALGYFTPQQ